MADTLFRGKRISDGKWVFGSFVKIKKPESDSFDCFIVEMSAEYYRVIPETVGQYTGREDKQRNKIFEGDIVAYPGLNKKGFPADIWYNQRKGSYEIRKIGYNHIGLYNSEYCYVVIGNIYDQPELLNIGR